MAEIHKIDEKAGQFLRHSDPRKYANQEFTGRRYGIINSNTAESLNAWMGFEFRQFPALQIIQSICLNISN